MRACLWWGAYVRSVVRVRVPHINRGSSATTEKHVKLILSLKSQSYHGFNEAYRNYEESRKAGSVIMYMDYSK